MTTSESATPGTGANDVSRADVLFVDMDGALLATDVLQESLLLSLKHGPGVVWRLPLWAAQGRARLKRELAACVQPDAERLPYRQDVLEFLATQKQQGRRLVLATASDRLWAERVAGHLGIFDDVLASDGQTNLKGTNKLQAIEAYCREHGFDGFGYLGDSPADLPIWAQAAESYVVAPGARLQRLLTKIRTPDRVFSAGTSRLSSVVGQLRPVQWIKNILLFVPLVLAHQWTDSEKVTAALLAFIAFCACSSAVYVINDLLDIEADRAHPLKRTRPFASGALPVAWGLPLAAGLLGGAFGLALGFLPGGFTLAMLVYFVTTTAYSIWLKCAVLVDVFLLAGLYTLRIVAGGFACDVLVSEWLIAFSLFLFTSLAFAKRYVEVTRLADSGATEVKGRGYVTADLSLIESMGPTSGYVAVLVLALYMNSDAVKQLYRNVWSLWLICPVLLYWISRIWLLAKRRQLSEDPVVFAIKDRVSLLLGVVSAVLLLIAVFIG